MTAKPGVWQPDLEQNTAKKIAGPTAITHLSLKSGGGAAAVSIYDGVSSDDVKPANKRWFLDASTQDADNEDFKNPITFSKGVYAVLEQGSNLNPILCFAGEQYTR